MKISPLLGLLLASLGMSAMPNASAGTPQVADEQYTQAPQGGLSELKTIVADDIDTQAPQGGLSELKTITSGKHLAGGAKKRK